ncbi:MAG: YebC/PmpR family DNA-binding transcriptional regulator [Candidatus Liptonbacteria bacterium]|nr:YebC/PmpR family DNA-binding transcriptional regulator [Candidatus Liptonbacteria bacterium]
MSGHSHWAGIKHKKGVTDQKRGVLFSKLLAAVTIAAKGEPDPEFNPRLRTAVETAREAQVPNDNITRAIRRAADTSAVLEELMFEAYGPGGTAILIEAITDSRNRTVAEVKHILSERGGKWADSGSVQWAFERVSGSDGLKWQAKFPMELSAADMEQLKNLLGAIDEHNDVQEVYTNAKLE